MCMGSAHSCALPELYYSAEAHEGHGEETCGQQSNRCALHCLGHFVQRQPLADACEEDQRESKAYCGSESVNGTGEETVLCAQRQFSQELVLVSYDKGYTENTAVGGDQRQEHTQCLIERRRDLLQHDLNHLHEGSDDEDEEDGLEELYAPEDE